jgi:hypothetical protein
MKWLVYILLAAEVVLVGCALTQAIASNMAVLMLAFNSVLLIWSVTRLRRKPSCCR